MRVIEFDIDLYIPHTKILTDLKQKDTTTFKINVFANSEPYQISNVILNVVRDNGNEFTQRTDIMTFGNTIEMLLDEYVFRDEGEIKFELVFTKNGARISTYIFRGVIEPTQYEDDTPLFSNAYAKPIVIDDWILTDNMYTITILAETHNLSNTVYIAVTEKQENNNYIPVTNIYNRTDDGTITIMSDIPYDGRIVMRR